MLVAGGDEAEQELAAGVIEWGEPDLIDLCRRRHRSTSAEAGIMPMVEISVADDVAGAGVQRWAVDRPSA